MSFLNIESVKERTFDAIVVGSGISGGWSAKELTGRGLKTLLLERGPKLDHIVDYPTTLMQPWEFSHLGEVTQKLKDENPIASQCYAFAEDTEHFFLKDKIHPYIQDKPFSWIRGYQVGGKSLMWARGTQRWSQLDFDGPARDGFAVEWPIKYTDLAPWYAYVERFAGISGNKDGLAQLPDGVFLPPHEQSCLEKQIGNTSKTVYKGGMPVIIGRCAHLTKPQPVHLKQGRGKCQHRDLCTRGCPFGGYFSSNSSTIPWAMNTDKLTLRPDSVVHSVIYDEKLGKATGVRVVDAVTKQMTEYYAKVIFLNASTLNSNLILMNSRSSRFPNGLGNDNGLLGKYILFHNFKTQIHAEFEGLKDSTTAGIRPNGSYIPRFRNLYKQEAGLNFQRGWAAGLYGGRSQYSNQTGLGDELKENLKERKWSNWHVGSHMMGETIPKESNFIRLDDTKKDDWGVPLLRMDVDYDENDLNMVKDYHERMTELLTKAGCTNIKIQEGEGRLPAPGLDIHEMGGVRMGKDPKSSLLNKWNQLHTCKNVFVTDGACMTSGSTQNPSLTFMAIAARAANYAADEILRKNL
jgi:choline dehydrogenase-like flavoprotein